MDNFGLGINSLITQAAERESRFQKIIGSHLTLTASIYESRSKLLGMMSTLCPVEPSIFENSIMGLARNISNMFPPVVTLYDDNVSEDEKSEINETNEKIISQIFQEDKDKIINPEESPIIILSPINDNVLKYLSEHMDEFYKLTGREFERVMAEIYSKLGYDVTLTQATRDGGKDIIIRKPEIIGDFIYYVECKQYSPKNSVNVGIVRNFVGTVVTDKVNGGIIATTSFFSKDARDFILDNNYDCQIKMHDFNMIRQLLNEVIR